MSLFSGLLTAIFGFPRFGSDENDSITRFIGGRTDGRAGEDTIVGGFANDVIRGGADGDLIRARTGHDKLFGEDGNDDLRAGRGDDTLVGGSGDDHLKGGSGADKFFFDPSNPDEGADVIKDLDIAAGDRIVLNAADVLRSAPGVASAWPFGDAGAVEGPDLDQDPDWTISESADGFVVVGHPSGTITINGLAFSEDLRFDNLLPAIEIANVVAGSDVGERLRGGKDDDFINALAGDDRLIGRRGDDVMLGGEGEDTLIGGHDNDLLDGGSDDDRLRGGDGEDTLVGGSGNDHLRGGDGVDRFVFDPSNADEGDDVVKDFVPGEDLLALSAADIAKATPEIFSNLASGDTSDIADPVALLTALDGSTSWSLSGADGSNNLVVGHPGGTIEFEGIGFAGQSFVDLAALFDADALNLQNGTIGNDTLAGGRGDDLLNGDAGLDLLIGDSGDDVLLGGAGADLFRFDPSNGNEGDDIIFDFDSAEGDRIQLFVADVIDSLEPALLDNGLQLTDLDTSAFWDINTDTDGNTTITHTGGTITLVGLGDDLLGFSDLSGSLDLVS